MTDNKELFKNLFMAKEIKSKVAMFRWITHRENYVGILFINSNTFLKNFCIQTKVKIEKLPDYGVITSE